MELALICVAVAVMVFGKHNKDTAQAAYKAGHEPPGLQKARMRHEKGGGRFKPARGGGQRPAGPGATRRTLATRWGHACEKARDRMEDKHQRWRVWYAEQAPQRDEAWRDKQRHRLERRGARLEQWQARWTRTKDSVNPTARAAEDAAWNENTARDTNESIGQEDADQQASAHSGTQVSTDGSETDPAERAEQDQSGSESAPGPATAAGAEPAAAVPSSADTQQTEGGATVYDQAAAQLNNHADEVEGYLAALSILGDEMDGEGWGAEVSGPLSEMHASLGQVAARYRDLAEQIKHQGDAVNDAYDAAPWAPDKAALVR